MRAADVIQTRLEAITSAGARPTAPGGSTPNALVVQALGAHLRVPLPAITDFDNASAAHAQGHPDFPWFDALPGAGAGFAPRLLVAFGAQRERDPSAEARQQDASIAPVTKRRGTTSWGPWRLQGPQFWRPTFGEWAAEAIRPSCGAPAYSQQPRAKGKAHQAAVRAVAFTWLRIR